MLVTLEPKSTTCYNKEAEEEVVITKYINLLQTMIKLI